MNTWQLTCNSVFSLRIVIKSVEFVNTEPLIFNWLLSNRLENWHNYVLATVKVSQEPLEAGRLFEKQSSNTETTQSALQRHEDEKKRLIQLLEYE